MRNLSATLAVLSTMVFTGSQAEAAGLRVLASNGVKVSAQDLPGARSVALPDLLNGSEL